MYLSRIIGSGTYCMVEVSYVQIRTSDLRVWITVCLRKL